MLFTALSPSFATSPCSACSNRGAGSFNSSDGRAGIDRRGDGCWLCLGRGAQVLTKTHQRENVPGFITGAMLPFS